MMLHQLHIQNLILSRLPPAELAAIRPHLEPVDLPKDFVIAPPDAMITHVYFFEQGLGSIVAVSAAGHKVEAGMFGREGFAPTPPSVGSDWSMHEVVVQAAGHGHRVPVQTLIALMETCRTFTDLLSKAAHNLATQASYTALSNAVHPVVQRLARWLLMSHDRLGQDELRITHDYLALMLSVRRPSVTTALHVLEGHGFIRAERGVIIMRNRAGLQKFAGDAYGVPEAEYRRLFDTPFGLLS
jgi:CRP-like cAMP-binding protein